MKASRAEAVFCPPESVLTNIRLNDDGGAMSGDDTHGPDATAGSAVFGTFCEFRQGDALASLTQDVVIDGLWRREGLSVRDRRLVTMGILAARGAFREAGIHIQAALTNEELSSEELQEVAVQVAIYAGWPMGNQFQVQVTQHQ